MLEKTAICAPLLEQSRAEQNRAELALLRTSPPSPCKHSALILRASNSSEVSRADFHFFGGEIGAGSTLCFLGVGYSLSG